MSGVSVSFGAELTGTLWGTIGSLLSVSFVDLLGVKSDVAALNADHIILGWMWGSSNRSLTITILDPSGWFTSTWCSIIRLVGVVIRGVLGSIAVLLVGPWPRTGVFCLLILLLIWIKFHSSVGLMASTWAPSMSDRGIGFSLPSNQTRPSEEVCKIYCSLGGPLILWRSI